MRSARLFFVGGVTSYRALFGFLSPGVFIPSLLVAPVFQVLLFVYIGRSAGAESDEFYVIGNAIQYASIPCLFAMTQIISGERFQQTLGFILVTPAPRLPLYLGRALPVLANAWFVSAFTFTVAYLLLDLDIPTSAFAPIALVAAVAAFSCTGLGLLTAGIGLVVRETAVLSNVVFGLLLVFTGANVATDRLPEWMQAVGRWLPFTHAIEAARRLAAGDALGDVAGLVGVEALIGCAYLVVGYAVLRQLELLSRRHATLERA
ncbi:MAG TPA: ABC transporter permease [Gaiellaceae bacterium]|nr:ABC transporter permease [Gaiellaceae bacterium]